MFTTDFGAEGLASAQISDELWSRASRIKD